MLSRPPRSVSYTHLDVYKRQDLERAAQIEAEIRHDLMAEIRTYAEQCPVGGGIIHLGATSMDVLDNVEPLRLREAADLLLVRLAELLRVLDVYKRQGPARG